MKFDSCEYCAGRVRQKRITVDLRRRERLYVFYRVPVGVCTKCGERYFPGTLLERLDELAEYAMEGAKKLSVPTLDFASAE